jgi:plastocyanin
MARTVRRSIVGWVLGSAVVAAALLAVPSVLAAGHAVSIASFSFAPGTITVGVGDTVTWSNSDSANHTATANDGSFDTGTIGNGSSKSVTFATAGTFAYHCSIHSAMTGKVVVAADAATAPPTDIATPAAAPSVAPPVGLVLVAFAGTLVAWRRFGSAAGR